MGGHSFPPLELHLVTSFKSCRSFPSKQSLSCSPFVRFGRRSTPVIRGDVLSPSPCTSYTSAQQDVASMHSFYPLITVLFTFLLYPDVVVASGAQTQDGVRKQRSNARILRLLSRSSDTCPSDYKQCGSGLPSNFCCGDNESCISLADDTTVVCCPEGENCDTIQPITCNIAGQNASAYPTASVHTTNLIGELPTCGSNGSGKQTCCPFGYGCSDDSKCVRSDGASSTGSLSVDTASFTSTLTISSSTGSATALIMASSIVSVPVVTPTSQSDENTSSGSSSSSSSSTKTRTIGIAAGSAAGGLAFTFGVAVLLWMRRRGRRRRHAERNHHLNRPASQFSETPPPLPPKESHQIPKRKRKSMLSWVPSVVNRTPAELPATPVSFSAWHRQWDQVPRPPNAVHRPYPRDSLSIEEIHELEARWLPQQERREVYYR